MSTGHKFFLALIAVIFIGIGFTFYAARHHDGPVEIISGGPFTSGETVTGETDWSFLKDRQTVAMQTMVPPRSRTMWIVVADNRPFVISSYMTTAIGKLWKQWPRTISEDNRAIVRVDGKLYEFELQRLSEGEIIDTVLARFSEKYGVDATREDVDTGSSWLFELKPRTP